MFRSELNTYHDLDFTHIVFEWVEEGEGSGGFAAFLYTDKNLCGYGRSQLEAAVNLVLAYKGSKEAGLIRPLHEVRIEHVETLASMHPNSMTVRGVMRHKDDPDDMNHRVKWAVTIPTLMVMK